MDWLEATVTTNPQGADIVSEALMQWGAKGTQIMDRADMPDPARPAAQWELVDASLIDTFPKEVTVKAWFPQEADLVGLQEHLYHLPALAGFELGGLRLSLDNVQDSDWAEQWKRFYKPLRLGRRIVIRPTWEEYQSKADDLVIDLDPGMAFGTGTHETTALCVEMMEALYKGGPVLDVGTGSGILAIAAACLGAQPVVAIDIDPVAVRTARENVVQNGLTAQVDVRQGDLLQGVEGQFALGVANILADVIILLQASMWQVLQPGGLFICSGIIKDRAQDVRYALLNGGWQLVEERVRGEWVAIAWRRPVTG